MAAPKRATIHWRAPALMVGSLIVGICLALGHHLFYKSLQGTEVSSRNVNIAGWKASSQQLNTAGGTAFAFVVKASLILATSVAYFQLLFRTLTTGTFTLRQLDNAYAGLEDLIAFGYLPFTWRFSMLALLALTAWLLPIAAIIAPAALSVTYAELRPSLSRPLTVPQPAFESLAFGTLYLQEEAGSVFKAFSVPSEEVSRVAQVAAAAGTILPIAPPSINASWLVSMDAPRLACGDLEQNLVKNLRNNILEVFNTSMLNNSANTDNANKMFTYLAWANDSTIEPKPFVRDGDTWKLQTEAFSVSKDILIAIFPRAATSATITNDTTPFGKDNTTLLDWFFENSTKLHCTLWPSTYTLNFTYDGLDQTQRIEIVAIDEPLTDILKDEWPDPSELLSYLRLPDDDRTVHQSNRTANRRFLRSASYQSIMTAFMPLVTGASGFAEVGVATLPYGGKNQAPGTYPTFTTQVFSTSLLHTRELAALLPPQDKAMRFADNSFNMDRNGFISLLPSSSASSTLKPFRTAIEELFFNVTLSMASSEQLLYNQSSPFAPPEVDVTFDRYGNIYLYAEDKLWLAYGIAIGVTIVNVVIGLVVMARTRASFTANLSTIVRIAKSARIESVTDMDEGTLPGKDPLPRDFASAKLSLRSADNLELREMNGAEYSRVAESTATESDVQLLHKRASDSRTIETE